MKTQRTPRPPRLAQRLLAWYCRPELLEDLQGDLNEVFDRHCRTKGVFMARVMYFADAIKFCRTYTVRTPDLVNTLTHCIMIGSYLRSASRNIARNKLFSAINIIGLSISMSVGLLLIGMLTDLLSYDKFHENHRRIYRVISQFQRQGDKGSDYMASTSLSAARAVKESIAGLEDVAIMHRNFLGDLTYEDKTVPLSGLMADESFFNVFSFQLLQGNPATALKDPFSMVLTETTARKLFNGYDALGKTVSYDERDYTVTGIVKDPPVFSHMKFDMLGSISTRAITKKDDPYDAIWANIWNAYAYVLLPENGDPKLLQENLDQICRQNANAIPNAFIQLGLQPMDDIITGRNLGNQIGPVMGNMVVRIFTAMTLVVILSACFNYTNLSVARSFRRSKEVGIRKTIGALKGHLMSQFVIESVIIALLALVFALGLFVLIKPHFIAMEYSLQELLVLDLSPLMIGLFVLFAIIVGVAAGFFPALFFSRMNAVQVFRGWAVKPAFKGITIRKVLIVFQFAISVMFITGTVIIYNQYKHFLSYDLGYNTENILNIRLGDNKPEVLKKELMELPEVVGISESQLIMSIGNYFTGNMKNPSDSGDSTGVYYNRIDENYLSLHDFNLIAGRNFNPVSSEDKKESEVIVNREVLKRFNIAGGDPSKAIGQVINVDHTDMLIVGVVDDFEYGKVNDRTGKEVVFRQAAAGQTDFLNVKVMSGNLPVTYQKIENIWKKIDPVHSLQAKFYDDQIEEAFRGFSASVKVGGFIAFLVVCIAVLGLLGMVIYTAETRLKEMSIRKVFGSTEAGILYRLGRGFLVLLGIAIAIALPITYLFFDRILLPDLANHAPLKLTDMLSGVVIIFVLALIMILSQTIKVARSRPAEVLRNE